MTLIADELRTARPDGSGGQPLPIQSLTSVWPGGSRGARALCRWWPSGHRQQFAVEDHPPWRQRFFSSWAATKARCRFHTYPPWSNLLGAMDAIRTPITFVGHGKACAGQSS